MSQMASTETGQSRRTLLIVSMLTVCFFAVANLPWTLDDYDQAKQAFVSFQMIGQQRWLYQTTPHEGMGARGGRHSLPYQWQTACGRLDFRRALSNHALMG